MRVFPSIPVAVITFLVAFACSEYARVVGFGFYALLSLPLNSKKFGRKYSLFYSTIFKIGVLSKIATYIISCSGILIAVEIGEQFSPNLLDKKGVAIGILAASIRSTLGIMSRATLMEIPNFHQMLKSTPPLIREAILKDKMLEARVQRAQFADMVFVDLFIVLESYGVSIVAAEHIGLIEVQASEKITMLQGVLQALNFLKFFSGTYITAKGEWANIIGTFYGISLIVFTMFFISLSSKLMDVR